MFFERSCESVSRRNPSAGSIRTSIAAQSPQLAGATACIINAQMYAP